MEVVQRIEDIALIITLYKRENYNKQLLAIVNQTVLPKVIYVWQNESHILFKPDASIVDKLLENNIKINHMHSKDFNFKFHGRFTIPLIVENKYICVLDDDTIPGMLWFESCLNHCNELNCIVSANGRGWDTVNEKQYGHEAPIENSTYVDSSGHSWFFKREWSHYMWREQALTFDNGEDIQLSATSKIYGNIPTVMPKQCRADKQDWGDMFPEYGWDDYASWKRPEHGVQRDDLFKYWISKGWKVLKQE